MKNHTRDESVRAGSWRRLPRRWGRSAEVQLDRAGMQQGLAELTRDGVDAAAKILIEGRDAEIEQLRRKVTEQGLELEQFRDAGRKEASSSTEAAVTLGA